MYGHGASLPIDLGSARPGNSERAPWQEAPTTGERVIVVSTI